MRQNRNGEQNEKAHFSKKMRLFVFIPVLAFLVWGILILTVPKPALWQGYNFSATASDRNGKLLKLTLSRDDKYRLFVPFRGIPPEAVQALLLYEDRWFYQHPGVNPLSMFRAAGDMLSGGRRQGASTITMQLARIVWHIDSSTLSGKLEQILRALQIELFYTKDEILEAYFNLAPYGGNIEGLEAAALIYFGKRAEELSPEEIFYLTVIPQNPGKRGLLTSDGRKQAGEAAGRLKKRWVQNFPETAERLGGYISFGRHLPDKAPHFTRRILTGVQGHVKTTLDWDYQGFLEEMLREYIGEQREKGVSNAAAIIVDARTMDVLAYAGSADFYNNKIFGQVDGTNALRSPGSALKPFIYALALQQGLIHPLTILKDVPRNYGLYTPENFDRSFYGMVNATQALVYSRNIPAVDLLLRLPENSFYELLSAAGVRNLRPPEYYGLALALGGAEVSMQNLAALYAMLYNNGTFRPLRTVMSAPKVPGQKLLSPEAAFLTLNMLSKNTPPGGRLPYPISWKTGTSYGYKDAWTAGVAGHFVVVVLIGNFDGTPNNAFVGRDMAAPLFFRIVRRIIRETGIPPALRPAPGMNLAKVDICRSSGDIADADCPDKVKSYFIPGVSSIKLSNISRRIPVDIATGLRACRHTPPQTVMKTYNFWPSDVLQAYAAAGISLKRPPAFKEDCNGMDNNGRNGRPPEIIFPAENTVILSPNGLPQHVGLKAALDADAEKVYWFADDRLLGSSRAGETFEAVLQPGLIRLKAVDDLGRSRDIRIRVKPVD